MPWVWTRSSSALYAFLMTCMFGSAATLPPESGRTGRILTATRLWPVTGCGLSWAGIAGSVDFTIW